jgi:hypothetical protein
VVLTPVFPAGSCPFGLIFLKNSPAGTMPYPAMTDAIGYLFYAAGSSIFISSHLLMLDREDML